MPTTVALTPERQHKLPGNIPGAADRDAGHGTEWSGTRATGKPQSRAATSSSEARRDRATASWPR